MEVDKKLIEYNIKKRNDTYFLVTESDLNEIKSRSNYTDWSFLFTSIFLGGLVSIIITISYGIDLDTNSKQILYTLLVVFASLSVACLLFSIHFHKERKDVINKIKGKEDISLQVEDYQEQTNIEKFKGTKRLVLNIRINQKESFLWEIKKNPVLSSLKSVHKINTKKVNYFTFLVYNVNTELKDYFLGFLKNHSFEYIDDKLI